MRRKDLEISEPSEIFAIMKRCSVCSLAFFNGEFPYIVPMNFGVTFDGGEFTLYFHGATRGTKLELLKQNNSVAFEMHCSQELVSDEIPCNFTMKYESVCGTGKIEILPEEEKIDALKIIMRQYSDSPDFAFNENKMSFTVLLRLKVGEISGKCLSDKRRLQS